MPYQITLAGQDITQYVDQLSIRIDDTLGQGSGAGSSGGTQGRASTIKFNTNIGPMSQAIGAGQPVPPIVTSSQYAVRSFSPALTGLPIISNVPKLVRQGEIIVKDATNTIVFGGYATKYTDTTTSVLGQTKQNFTAVDGIDYSTSLQRTVVNEAFSAQTDIQIIRFIMQKYAPWIKLDYLPANPAYLFPVERFRNITVEGVIQTIAGITGYLVYIDYLKYLHYIPPTSASSAPYSLSSSPNFIDSFPHAVVEFLTDDNAAINRVLFFGGTKLSNNYWQDLSPMVNGNNKTFTLAYAPSTMADGHYHVQLGGSNGVGGVEQKVGTGNQGTGPADKLISAGGTAQCLLDAGSKSLTFDVAPSGTTLFVGYRYSYPLSLLLTDEASHKFFGPPYLDGVIDDSTIFDLATAVQRCKVLLAQHSFGLTTLKVDVYNKPGIQAGMLLRVVNPLRGINGTYLVQQVQTDPLGAGNFIYHISMGAWNWNLIDWLLKVPTLASFQDDQPNESQEIVIIMQVATNVQVHDGWTRKERVGPYYARATQGTVPRALGSTLIGDGHDAFPGFSTVSS